MEYAIIGGGIAGLTLAIALRGAGKIAQVFEAAPEIKTVGAGLVLAPNAMKALRAIGLKDELTCLGRQLDAFKILDKRGRVISHTDNSRLNTKYGEKNFTIHRAALHEFLLSKLDPSTIHTNKRVMDVSQSVNDIRVNFQDGTSIRTEYLIMADGIHSAIRKKLLPASVERYAGYTCWRAVIDNSRLNLTETSETWGREGRFGIVPLNDNRIYWFACVKAAENDPKFRDFLVPDLLQVFKGFHDPIPALIEATRDEDLIWNDIIDIAPIHRYSFGRIVLIGDAAHATTPNMGQGACQAIEDAVVLAREVSRHSDAYFAFQAFEKNRLKRTHWVVNTSRRMGEIAQLDNPFLTGIRNFIMRHTPARFQEGVWDRLYDVRF